MEATKQVTSNVPDFSVPHEEVRSQHIEKLDKAKAFVAKVSKSRTTVEIKIPGGIIMTTCPEKWEQHNKAYLRGNAISSKKG